MSWNDAIGMIGRWYEGFKVIGVDCRPPKCRVEGVYLVLSRPGEPITYEKVG